MIDNVALLLFGLLILYTVFRAIKLDKLLPWFSAASEPPQQPSRKKRN
jgi:uncharacterized paraquat-inducible protein A